MDQTEVQTAILEQFLSRILRNEDRTAEESLTSRT